MGTVVVATREPGNAFRYYAILQSIGHQVFAADNPAQVFTCMLGKQASLLIVEDGFIEASSAHGFIKKVRSIPGPESLIPIIRICSGPVSVSPESSYNHAVETIRSPATASSLEAAIRRLNDIS
tara:strand:+ start:9326 stop:9697 length:372 start_codon:yes stop_codon:yes gene_type:complete